MQDEERVLMNQLIEAERLVAKYRATLEAIAAGAAVSTQTLRIMAQNAVATQEET